MPWRAVTAAMAGLLASIGLARFGYAPLLPAVIAHGWFRAGTAAYLGAANLLGYLAGAVAARWAGRRLGAPMVLRGAMLTCAASLAACSVATPFAWFFGWRLASGIAGGLIMILAPSAAVASTPPAHRGLAAGLVMTGVGLGIAASGTLVPLLIRWGLTEAWLGLAAICLALTVFSWRGWPEAVPATAATGGGARFGLVCTSYGLCAVGLSPHMVFLVDYVARGLGRGLDAGSLAWVAYGLGALCGPVTAGRVVDRAGSERAFHVVLAVEAAVVGALLYAPGSTLALAASALFGGAITTGITATMIGRIERRAAADGVANGAARQRGWTLATVMWAIGQAAGTYGMAWLFAHTGGYAAMFVAALAAVGCAAVLEVRMALSARLPATVGPA